MQLSVSGCSCYADNDLSGCTRRIQSMHTYHEYETVGIDPLIGIVSVSTIVLSS